MRGKKQKVVWRDIYGNSHDLDFVLESGGSDAEIGVPIAFVECAWRSRTKHSRNKVQEIQGAILPIMEVWKDAAPRKAAILAGVFTPDSITQMESVGFYVALIDHADIVYIKSVRILPLHGAACDCTSLVSAIEFIKQYKDTDGKHPFVKYEIQIGYNKGDKIDGQFHNKKDAVDFLQTFDLSIARKLRAMQDLLVKETNSEE